MNIFNESKGLGDNIVLLDGALDSHLFFNPLKEMLSKHYRVTWLDQPGIGKTPWQPQIHTIFDMVEAILPVLPENAVYIGWSFGGLLALALASLYPGRVKRLINICSTPRFVEDGDWIGVPKPGFSPVLPDIEKNGLTSFLGQFLDDEFSDFKSKPACVELIKSYFPNNNEVDYKAVEKRILLVDQTDLREQLSALNCPVDYILGGKDAAVPNEQHKKIVALNPKVKLHVIPSAKHMPFYTHNESFNVMLNDILEGQ